ncbi:hypothetical protein FA15DRAFT_697915 [Coprinopsis marcescibilis]|uniref:F-box domain-containing protein n=1 Tax=Coprinopsis marcescibilis TaxID=230819 RepID=A0A5C3KFB5_COPMA|nr:hypothetical protein FA15DRAFT_697915 [Coprinopsis marcescibilis]
MYNAELPPELARLVAHRLKDDKRSLQNASLISSTFRGPCQEVLFEELQLECPNRLRPTSYHPGPPLLSIIEQSPFLAKYVNAISIKDDFWEYSGASWRPGWFSKDEVLPCALKKILSCGKIKRFELAVGPPYSLAQPEWWCELPALHVEVLSEMCRSPYLTELTLNGSPIELSYLCPPLLKRLAVRETFEMNSILPPDSSTSEVQGETKIQELHICPVTDISKKFDISHLQTLKAGLYLDIRREVKNLHRLLEQCGSSLRTLSVADDRPGLHGRRWWELGGCIQQLSLSMQDRLEEIAFDVRVMLNHSIGDPVAAFLRVLETLPPSNSLQWIHLVLRFDWKYQMNDLDGTTQFPNEGWRQLNVSLRERMEKLQCFHIEFKNDPDIREFIRVRGRAESMQRRMEAFFLSLEGVRSGWITWKFTL